MLINNVLLKAKNIEVSEFAPQPKMKINMHRKNLMPAAPDGNRVQCQIDYSIIIQSESEKVLAAIKLSYLIMITLQDEVYEQTAVADKAFGALQAMFIKAANDLLRETNYPLLPIAITVA